MRMRSNLLPAALAWVCCAALAGCGSDSGGGDENTPITPAPQSLVGDWKYGVSSFTNFWGDQGQYYGNAGGVSVFFTFQADGHYKQQVYVNQRNYSCLTETWTESTGTATFDSSSFTIYPTVGRYKASDNCVDRNNFDRAMTDQERQDFVKTFLWKFDVNPNDGKTYLMVGFDQDTWSYFDRAQ